MESFVSQADEMYMLPQTYSLGTLKSRAGVTGKSGQEEGEYPGRSKSVTGCEDGKRQMV